jgi:hypothetical protein
MVDRLEISALQRAGDSSRRERRSVDFLVNGQSLFRLLGADRVDMCGRFSSDTPEINAESEKVFTGEASPDLESGRVMLFVCPECGDIGCGAFTLKISFDSGLVIWSDFAYENDYDETMTDFGSFQAVGPFRFKTEDYIRTISEAVHA